eukprot:TRINITY_DN18866_c0_g1_i2.p1 TRINITY_DN18866_c0_g1~~TRINITY_DN18866_c0_g1_i2.p1  ORF type:complete len:327 (-),score=122.63 TRINITY_DN18866_c0_g1_i2:56-1036(-)
MKIMDDMLDDEVVTARVAEKQRLKMAYLEKAHNDQTQYIKDLETSLLINKQIIGQLCAAESSSKKSKEVISKLNAENTQLTAKVKRLMGERNGFEGKLLIQAQIINECRMKEEEHVREFTSAVAELKEQLDKKEYAIQFLERRCIEAEKVIVSHLKNSPEVAAMVGHMKIEIPNVGISNVIEQNRVLKSKLAAVTGELGKLKHLGFLTARNAKSEIDARQLLKNDEGKLDLKYDELIARASELEKANKELVKSNEELQKELEEVKENYECLLRNYQGAEIGKSNELNDKSLSKISNIHVDSDPEIHTENSQELPEMFDVEVKDIKQ